MHVRGLSKFCRQIRLYERIRSGRKHKAGRTIVDTLCEAIRKEKLDSPESVYRATEKWLFLGYAWLEMGKLDKASLCVDVLMQLDAKTATLLAQAIEMGRP
jgi:hypothetical protein